MLKRCCTCKLEKPLDQFCRCKSNKDGLSKRCRACNTAAVLKTRKTPHGQATFKRNQKRYWKGEAGKANKRRSDRKYAASENGRVKIREHHKRHRQTELGQASQKRYESSAKGLAAKERYRQKLKSLKPEVIKAHSAVHNGVRDGKMPHASTLSCHHCGRPAVEYHHHLGYDREHWLDVIPLCKPCHHKTRGRLLS